MKKAAILLSAFFMLTAFTTGLTTGTNDKAHSQLTFTVNHMGISDVSGVFNEFNVKVSATKEDFSDVVFELTANTGSIDTRVEQRNNHLKSADFFDVENFPTMTFKSTSIKNVGKDQYKLSGNLTIRDITKPVTMDLTYRGTIENQNVSTAGFQLTGSIKRSDFQVGPKFPEPMISDEVRIKADGEFKLN